MVKRKTITRKKNGHKKSKLGRDNIKHELQEGRGKADIHESAEGTREGKVV